MRLTTRLDALTRRLPCPRVVPDVDAAIGKICEMLEKYAPIPSGEVYTDVDVRLDAALDRLYTARVGIAAGPHTSRAMRIAAACGMTTAEYRDAMKERAGR